MRKGEGNEKAGFGLHVFLALMTGALAMAKEPVYDVLFFPKDEYTVEKGKFKATVPQVRAISSIDERTPIPECNEAVKAVNEELRAYVDKAYSDYLESGEPDTWIYPMIMKNGDNVYSIVMFKKILHDRLDVYIDEAFTFLQNTGKRVSWKELVRKKEKQFMTVENLKKNIRDGRFFYKEGVWRADVPKGFSAGYDLQEMPGDYRFYVDQHDLIIFILPRRTDTDPDPGYFELNSGRDTKYSLAVG